MAIEEPIPNSQEPKPKVDPEQLARIELELLEKVKQKAETEKLEAQAEKELEGVESAPVRVGGVEQTALMIAAGLMVISLPFLHYLLAIILTLFAVVVSLLAGLTSPKQQFSPVLNLLASLIGFLFFELSAITVHATAGFTASFLFDQLLAFIFMISTYFSMKTYRHRALE